MADEEVAKQEEEETVEAVAEGAGEEETPASTVPAVRYLTKVLLYLYMYDI